LKASRFHPEDHRGGFSSGFGGCIGTGDIGKGGCSCDAGLGSDCAFTGGRDFFD